MAPPLRSCPAAVACELGLIRANIPGCRRRWLFVRRIAGTGLHNLGWDKTLGSLRVRYVCRQLRAKPFSGSMCRLRMAQFPICSVGRIYLKDGAMMIR